MHLVTLGCARNEVDSEQLAGRLAAGGFRLVADPEAADAVLVNTCGFIEAAKKDSVDTLLAAADLKASGRAQAVVAVGCLAERYGHELAAAMPEADAVLGFDDYADDRCPVAADRRRGATGRPCPPGPAPAAAARTRRAPGGRRCAVPLASGPTAPTGTAYADRHRLASGPTAPLKIASGCDRRCTFCAIPAFRGAFVSRPRAEIVAEARWLADHGVRELFLVSENSTSYGKDLGDLRALEQLLAELSTVEGIEWIRVSYLQPAEMRPSLIEAMTGTDKVVPYFDLSFQHAAPTVLRRMRRFGSPDAFLGLIDQIRAAAPYAGIRSNVICGFPGETEAELGSSDRLPRGRRAGCDRRVRLLRRGRHSRRPAARATPGGGDRRPARPDRRPRRGADQPARREPDRRAASGPGRGCCGRRDWPCRAPGAGGRRRGAAARRSAGAAGRSPGRRNARSAPTARTWLPR